MKLLFNHMFFNRDGESGPMFGERDKKIKQMEVELKKVKDHIAELNERADGIESKIKDIEGKDFMTMLMASQLADFKYERQWLEEQILEYKEAKVALEDRIIDMNSADPNKIKTKKPDIKKLN